MGKWCLTGDYLWQGRSFHRSLLLLVVVLALFVHLYLHDKRTMTAAKHRDKVIPSHPLNKGPVWAKGSHAGRPKRNLFQGEFQNKS